MATYTKPISEMTAEEYQDYLLALSDRDFMLSVTHDIRKSVSIVHGYLSLIRLDMDEDEVENEKLELYLQEMQRMLERSYLYLDAAEEAYNERLL